MAEARKSRLTPAVTHQYKWRPDTWMRIGSSFGDERRDRPAQRFGTAKVWLVLHYVDRPRGDLDGGLGVYGPMRHKQRAGPE